MTRQNKSKSYRQNGNAFLIILLGIALFASLAFTISRSMRSDNTTRLSERDAVLAAADIMNYAQKVERAVNRVRRKGCSEEEISFEQNIVAGYTNASAPADNSCHIFETAGGSITWQSPPPETNNGDSYFFTGNTCVHSVPQSAGACSGGDSTDNEELALVLPNLDLNLCIHLNDVLEITNPAGAPPQDAGNSFRVANLFQGDFTDGSAVGVTELQGQTTGCYEGDTDPASGTYHFYYVLLER